MGFTNYGPKLTRNSDAEITRYLFVLYTATGVKQFDGTAGARAHAVAVESVSAAGFETTIQDQDTAQITAAAAFDEAAEVTTATGGKCQLAVSGNVVMGISLQAATADGDITAVRLIAPYTKA